MNRKLMIDRLRWLATAPRGAQADWLRDNDWHRGIAEVAQAALVELERPGWRCRLFGHAFEPRYRCEPDIGYLGDVCYRCGTEPAPTFIPTVKETTHEAFRETGLDPSGVPSDCNDGDRNG